MVDETLCGCLEDIWGEGDSLPFAQIMVAGVQHFKPALRRHIPGAWQLLKSWGKSENPCRAAPMDPQVVQTLAWKWILEGRARQGVAMLVGHHCLLLTAEICPLRVMDICVDARRREGVLRLVDTKSGHRSAMDEGVVITDPLLVDLVRWVTFEISPCETLVGLTSGSLRKALEVALRELGLEGFQYKPYSLRRGGATTLFKATRNMSYVVVRGRWASQRTARIYVLEAVASLTKLMLTARQQAHFQQSVAELFQFTNYAGYGQNRLRGGPDPSKAL
jgi:hypothetical protein